MCGLCSFGKYELHDLLMLDDGSVGVLIAVAKDFCKVLTNKVCISLNQSACVLDQRSRSLSSGGESQSQSFHVFNGDQA